jgi:hypothetical protein
MIGDRRACCSYLNGCFTVSLLIHQQRDVKNPNPWIMENGLKTRSERCPQQHSPTLIFSFVACYNSQLHESRHHYPGCPGA